MLRALSLLGLAVTAGCSSSSYTLVAELGSGVTGASAVEVALVPSCASQTLGAPPASAVYSAVLRRGETATMTGMPRAGTFGLYGLARNAGCTVVGAGCSTVTLVAGGSGELVVPLSAATGAACPMACDRGECVSMRPDAAVPDGGRIDGGGVDGGGVDGGEVDGGGVDGGGVDGGEIDAGSEDSGVVGPSPIERDHAARLDFYTTYCNCRYTGGMVGACISQLTEWDPSWACQAEGYAVDPSALYERYDCLATAREREVACIAGSMCDGTVRSDCTTAYDTARRACPTAPTGAQGARDSAFAACAARDIVGSGTDSCDDTAMPSMGVGAAVFAGNTVGDGDHRTPSCVDSGGADVAHRWAAPADGMYRIDTVGSDFDTALMVLPSCSMGAAELACDDDTVDYSSTVTLMFTAGTPVQLIVDGYYGAAAGNYVVNINAVP